VSDFLLPDGIFEQLLTERLTTELGGLRSLLGPVDEAEEANVLDE
jgi:hypothetical protein